MRLTELQARRRLAAARVARLATTGADGRPHVVPVTFAVEGNLIYTAVDHKPKTTRELRRLRNIRENPLVSVLADDYSENWNALWWARADGRATVVTDSGAIAHPVDLLVGRYAQYHEHRPAGPLIAIEVTTWAGWSAA